MTITPATHGIETRDYASVLDRLTGGRELPAGCDTWALKSVRPDLQTSNGFTWPSPGHWAYCDPTHVIRANRGGCPSCVGDGLCVATDFAGMASGGITARTLLLVAYRSEDLLGSDGGGTARVTEALVVALLDGEATIRQYGEGADLYAADVTGADLYGVGLYGALLYGANLSRTDLGRADLGQADLRRAELAWANLAWADLTGARLAGAHLPWARLTGAHLADADLTGAILVGADLSGADLSGADLTGVDLSEVGLAGATVNAQTLVPAGFTLPASMVRKARRV